MAPGAPVPTIVLAAPVAALTRRTRWLLVSATNKLAPAASTVTCQGALNSGVTPSAKPAAACPHSVLTAGEPEDGLATTRMRLLPESDT